MADLGFTLPSRFNGIRAVGDVHGDAPAFLLAIEGAKASGLFVVQLGDLVDRGPNSPGCLQLAMDMTGRGDGLFLLGNHDDKLRRALAGHQVSLHGDLARTLTDLGTQPFAFRAEVMAALAAAPVWLRCGDCFLVHAAFDPIMLGFDGPDAMPTRRMARKYRNLALRGLTTSKARDDGQESEGYPTRRYGWLDQIPDGLTVLIGHDMLSSDTIIKRRGAKGGHALFCDTGCGKGGKLSWIDIVF